MLYDEGVRSWPPECLGFLKRRESIRVGSVMLIQGLTLLLAVGGLTGTASRSRSFSANLLFLFCGRFDPAFALSSLRFPFTSPLGVPALVRPSPEPKYEGSSKFWLRSGMNTLKSERRSGASLKSRAICLETSSFERMQV